jgi:hypothetical protein
LRLNRDPLVAYRLRKQNQSEEARLLNKFQHLINLLGQMQLQQAALLENHRTLLEQQRVLLHLFLK